MIEEIGVLHWWMVAVITTSTVGKLPMCTLTVTLGTEIKMEWIQLHVPNQRVHLTNSILQGRTRQAPSFLRVQLTGSFGCVGVPILDIMRFV
jgi:predicted HAD superfamily phosphohydrolase